MNTCRTDIDVQTRERDEYRDAIGAAGVDEVRDEAQECIEGKVELGHELDECRERNERLEPNEEEEIEGVPIPDSDAEEGTDTTFRIRWDSPQCTAPSSRGLRDACLGDCRRQLSILIDITNWYREVLDGYYEDQLSSCEEETTHIEEQLEEEGCRHGTIVPPSGTCSATPCR